MVSASSPSGSDTSGNGSVSSAKGSANFANGLVGSAKARGKRSLTHPVPECPLAHAHAEYLRQRQAEGLRDTTLPIYRGALYRGALTLWERWCEG